MPPPRATAKEAETEQWIKSAFTDSAGLPVLSYGRESTNAVWLCAFSFRLPKRLMKITALTVFSCVASRNKRAAREGKGLGLPYSFGRAGATTAQIGQVRPVAHSSKRQSRRFCESTTHSRFKRPKTAGPKTSMASFGPPRREASARATQRVAGARLIRPRRASPAPLMHRCARGRRFLTESRYSLSVQADGAWVV